MTVDVTKMLADTRLLSAAYTSRLDRSELGYMAVDAEALALCDVMFRMNNALHNAYGTGFYNSELIAADNALEARCAFIGVNSMTIRTEMFYWWKKDGFPVETYNGYNAEIINRLKVLDVIAANPDKHEYFAAGIWDVDLIERFIADGVDPAIALELRAVNR